MNVILITLIVLVASVVLGTGFILYGIDSYQPGQKQVGKNVAPPEFEGYRAFSLDMHNWFNQTDNAFSDHNFRAVIMESGDGKNFIPVSYVPFYPNATTIDITKEMSDKLFLAIYPITSGNFADVEENKNNQYYLIPNQVSADNQDLTRFDTMDVNNIGMPYWVWKLEPEFIVPDMNYGSTNIPEQIFKIETVKFNDPINFTLGNVDSSIQANPFDYKMTVPSTIELHEKSAIALSGVMFKISSSRADLINDNKSAVVLPHVGLVMLSNFTKYHQNGTNTDYYKYDFTAPFSSHFGLGDGQQMIGLKGSDYLFESLTSPSDEEYPITIVLDLNVKDPTRDSIKILETVFYLDPFQLTHTYTLQPVQIGGNFTSDIQSSGDIK